MIERYIDYMQFSAPINERDCTDKKFEIVHPVRFYSRGYRHPLGYRLYFGNPNSKKALIVASGAALENMRGESLNDYEIIQYAMNLGGKITRLDLAVTEWNTFDGMIELGSVKQWFSEGLITSKLCVHGCKIISSLQLDGKEYPETCYIGDLEKRGRLGLFRAYDKGIELDLGQYMATRLELEIRGDSANATAKRIAQTNDIAGNFRSHFNVKHKDFERIMDADAVQTHRGKSIAGKEASEENDARWVWLMKQVAPALRKAIREDIAENKGADRLNQFLIKAGMGKKVVNELARRVQNEAE